MNVSIVIPCYNAEPWLAATLISALRQTPPDCEIIVVDDGSTDSSLSVARRHSGNHVQIVSQPNRGAAAARNHGLSLSRGNYVQFLDADDILAPGKISSQLAVLQRAPASIVAGPWGRFEADPENAVFAPEDNWRDSDPVDWLCLNFAGRGMMPPAAWLASRTLLDRAGPWDERLTLNDDGEYFCRVLLASEGVRFCPEARSLYRSNLAGSLSAQSSESAWRSAFLSHRLCASHLLGREDTPRVRRACADLFQRLAYAIYPDCPDIVDRCEAETRRYGGSALRPGGGVTFRALVALFGWKFARRWQSQRRRATQSK